MRRITSTICLLVSGIIAAEPGGAAVRYFEINGSSSPAENACPAWIPATTGDDCSYNASDPSGLGVAQWIGPVFSAGYYAPGQSPLVFTNPLPPSPVLAPAPLLPLAGKTGIPIARGFISIDDRDTPEPGDDIIGGTIEFGAFERNVGISPSVRVIESFDRIIHRINPPPSGGSNVTEAVPNAGGGIDYTLASSGGAAAFPGFISGSTAASGGFSDIFPSEIASQASQDAADVPYWLAPGANGIARFEGASASTGSATTATVWGYGCNAGGGAACLTQGLNWDGDSRARFSNLLLRFATDDSGNITAASAYLVNEAELSSGAAAADSWTATTLAFTGAETTQPEAFDDRAILINGLDLAATPAVLANDLPGQSPVVVSIVSPPSFGSATVLSTPPALANVIQYTPLSTSFQGVDTLTYEITDANNNTATATLQVLLTDPLTCADDLVNSERNTATIVNVLANDAGYDLPPVTVKITDPPDSGTAVVNPDKSITFTPPQDATGFFTFGYQLNDGAGEPGQCLVTVNVQGDVAVDDEGTIEDFVTQDINVLNNDRRDVLVAPILIEITVEPTHGKAFTLPPAGSQLAVIRYTADAGYDGPDTIRYRLTDAVGYVSNEATVNLTVVESTPVAVNDTATVEDGTATGIDVIRNDSALADRPVTLTITSGPSHGTAEITESSSGTVLCFNTPCIAYRSDAGYAGPDSLSYTVTDADGDVSNVAAVSITVRDTSPVATNDTFGGDARTSVPLNVLANDIGLVDSPLTIEILEQPSLGIATVLAASSTPFGRPGIGYSSGAGTSGPDTLRYRVIDADGDASNEATVSINVINAVPAAVDDSRSLEDGTPLTIGVLSNDSGLSNWPLTITITERPPHGTVTVNAVTLGVPTLTYRPSSGFTGSDTFRYRFNDGDGDTSNEAVVTLTISDSTPVAVDDAASGDAREATAVDVLANDTGLVDGPVKLQITGQPTNGTATLVTVVAGGGTRPGIAYASDINFSGTDTVSYQITDQNGDVSNEATLTLTVTNAVPAAVDDQGGDTGLLPFNQGAVIERIKTPFDILQNDTGRGNRPLAITITQQPLHGTAEVDSAEVTGRGRPGISYRSEVGYVGRDSFRYTFTDADGEVSNEAIVSFDVVSILTATDDGSPFPLSTTRDRPIRVKILDNDGGLAFGLARIEIVAELNGTATVNTDNTVTFSPSPGFTGRFPAPDCQPPTCIPSAGGGFRYRLVDAANQSDEAIALVDVFPPPVNDQGGGGSALDRGLLGLLLAAGASARWRRRKPSGRRNGAIAENCPADGFRRGVRLPGARVEPARPS